MENFYVLDHLKAQIELEPVLLTMECYPDSPVYEEVEEEFNEIREDMLALCRPVGILGVGSLGEKAGMEKYPAGTKVIYGVISVGNGIKECSTKAFQEGDYVKGMLCDAMADAALFSLEGQMMERLREVCREHQVGVEKRLEAPHDISMWVQQEAWEYLELEKRFGIKLSSGLMYDPVKTSCQVFILTENQDRFKANHDCRNCPNVTCMLRQIPKCEVEVKTSKGSSRMVLEEGESLLEALRRNHYQFSACCGGNGLCGKCRVQILEGKVPAGAEDKKIFGKEELEQGFRLACRVYPKEDLVISLGLGDESDFEVLSAYEGSGREDETIRETAYEVAVDIGTTTLAMQLLGKKSGRVVHTVTAINRQRAYGADVISRIQASNTGERQTLKECIQQDLAEGIKTLAREADIQPERIQRIAIAGNTTMGHLLRGFSCETLGVYPFTPVEIGFMEGSFQEILNSELSQGEVLILPGISTFVGGDIAAGLLSCGFDQKEEICLLVDLGTNGEMALGNCHKILTTSTAAGPAFEGGNITWGMGSVAGAICSVKIQEGRAFTKTIKDKEPMGLCGTGVVETAAELIKEELVDETGLLDEEWFEDGFPLAETKDGKKIVFTQQDVREIQLAKAAVRAGVETLLKRYGVGYEEVEKVCLAGGFGHKLDKDKAIRIGMLPSEFKHKITAIGNSALSGAAVFLKDPEGKKRLGRILEVSEEINLSADKDFNQSYMDSMMFEEE